MSLDESLFLAINGLAGHSAFFDQLFLRLGATSTLYVPVGCAVAYWIWRRRWEALLGGPFLAGAIGLSVINSKAVFSALCNRQSAFARTPKYNLTLGKPKGWSGKKYRAKFELTVVLELLLVVYTSAALWYASGVAVGPGLGWAPLPTPFAAGGKDAEVG